MYGLMKARSCSLSREEKRRRRLHYCGTCKTIGGLYGHGMRFLLNEDAVFLAELLSALTETDPNRWEAAYRSYNCLALPSDVQTMPAALRYASAATLVMSELKVADRLADGGGPWWKLVDRGFGRAFRSATRDLECWDFPVRELWKWMAIQSEREGATSPETGIAAFDRFAEPTAAATGLVFRHGGNVIGLEPEWLARLEEVGRAFGMIVYALDAVEDLRRDRRRGEFNALHVAFSLEGDRLPASVRRTVTGYVWDAARRFETSLGSLPIPEEQTRMFIARLRANLTRRLNPSLPVIQQHRTTRATSKPSLHERFHDALAVGRKLAARYRDGQPESLGARFNASLIFLVCLATALVFPQPAREAQSYRECLDIGLNLMFVGAVLASVVAVPRRFGTLLAPLRMSPVESSPRRRKNQANTGEESSWCDRCSDCGDCHCPDCGGCFDCDACCHCGSSCGDCGSCCECGSCDCPCDCSCDCS